MCVCYVQMRLGHGGGYGSVGHTVTTGGGLGGGAGGRSRGGGAGPISAAATGGGGGGGGGSLQCYKLVQVPGQQLFYPQQAGPAAMHVSQVRWVPQGVECGHYNLMMYYNRVSTQDTADKLPCLQ